MFKSNFWITVITIFVSAVISIGAGIYNGFPIVHQDSAFYMHFGYDLNDLPPYRPITYCLILKYLGNLWYVIFYQGLIWAYLINRLLFTFGIKKVNFYTLLTVLILSLTTSYSYVCSQLMADAYTANCIICLVILLLNHRISLVEQVIIGIIFIVSTMTHYSHSYMSLAVMLIFFLIYFTLRHKNHSITIKKSALVYTSLLVIFSLFAVKLLNLVYFKEFVDTKNSQAFVMARLVESNILSEFLSENCAKSNYKLCQYKDKLPYSSSDFLWKSEIIGATGGMDDKDGEYKKIIREILSQPKYLSRFIQESLKESFGQLFFFDVGEELYSYDENTWPFIAMKKWYPQHLKEYKISLQLWKKLNFYSINERQFVVIYISLFVIYFYFMLLQSPRINAFDTPTALGSVLIILFVLVNAFFCGTFSGVYARYQSRIIWLVPLITIVVLIKIFDYKSINILSKRYLFKLLNRS